MNLSDFGKIIVTYGAPILGTVVGGPAGGAIAQIIAKAFGVNSTDPTALMNAISVDPNAAAKLAEIESNNKVELERLITQGEIDRLKASNENTVNAREMNIKNHSMYPQFLSTMVVVGFFSCIYWIAAYKQEKIDHEVLYLLLGILGTSFGAVVNFWLGSSMDKSFNIKEYK